MPAATVPELPAGGSHLERYTRLFSCVEINSSFYRPHRHATYARWSETVPAAFRFSVKMPRAITHEARLRDPEERLDAFVEQVAGLGEKLGCILVQLPPSLSFDPDSARRFFEALRERIALPVVMEPRHPAWFQGKALELGKAFGVSWVWAHPRPSGIEADLPDGPELNYLRLHGAPRVYYSAYDEAFIDAIAQRFIAAHRAGLPVWCIFDNTARGHAIPNARSLLAKVERTLTVQR